MVNPKTKIGIVGTGRMGTLHLEKFLCVPDVEVVGVFEPNSDKALEIETRFRVKVFSSLDDLLFEADGAVLASPTPTHYAIARRALDAGVHILIEKPMCETTEEAIELHRLAKEKRLICQVGFIERFRLLSILKDFELGPVRFIEAHRLAPQVGREAAVDVVSDLMIHDLDLVLSLIGEEPHSISAIGVPVITPHFDVANVRLEFPSGAIANLTASRIAARAQRKFRIFSLLRYCSMDFLTNAVDSYSQSEGGAIVHKHLQPKPMDALQEQCSAFVSSIQKNSVPVVTAQDGVSALRISNLIREKIVERAAWKISSFHAEVPSLQEEQ